MLRQCYIVSFLAGSSSMLSSRSRLLHAFFERHPDPGMQCLGCALASRQKYQCTASRPNRALKEQKQRLTKRACLHDFE
jgi:hypothetical protein